MRKFSYLALVLFVGLVIWACKRNDDEPTYPSTAISRLYVSFSDEQDDPDLNEYKAVVVFAKADGDSFPTPDTLGFNSPVHGGRGLYFDPNTGVLFQGNISTSTYDFNSVYLYTISSTGSIGSRSTFTDTLLREVRHLTYDYSHELLYVSSKDTSTDSRGYIHSYTKPLNLSSTVKKSAHQHLRLNFQPWGLVDISDKNQLLISSTSTQQIVLIDSISTKKTGDLSASSSITITGAVRLRGMAYSESRDVLAVADYSTSSVYIFENALETIEGGGSVTPTRTIKLTGTLTPLPMDVAIDDRTGSDLLYVVDAANKALLRYSLDADGSAEPQIRFDFENNQTPYAISLDARAGTSSDSSE